jgi:glycosyltransferase
MTSPQAPQRTTSPEGESAHKRPRISVITVCQNDQDVILSCLASVAEQTNPDIEHIVVYRQGHDLTLQKLLQQQDRLTIVFAAADESKAHAWNRGLTQASGEVIGFLAPHDTLAHPGILAEVGAAFQDPWIAALYGDIQHPGGWVKPLERVHRSGPFQRQRLTRGWAPPLNTLFVRRLWLQRIGGFKAELHRAGDYHAVLQLFTQPFFKAHYLSQPIVRQRARSMALRQLHSPLLDAREELRALRHTRVGGLGTLALRCIGRLTGTLR